MTQRALLIYSLLLLSACASLPPDVQKLQERNQQLEQQVEELEKELDECIEQAEECNSLT